MEKSDDTTMYNINWNYKFIQISSDDNHVLVQTFVDNLHYFLILEEIFHSTVDEKLIRHLCKIISVLYVNKPNFMLQLDLFLDESIPNHPIAHLYKLLIFCDTNDKEVQLKISNTLFQIINYSYYSKHELLKIIYESITYYGDIFLTHFNKDNLKLLIDIFLEFDTQKWLSLKAAITKKLETK